MESLVLPSSEPRSEYTPATAGPSQPPSGLIGLEPGNAAPSEGSTSFLGGFASIYEALNHGPLWTENVEDDGTELITFRDFNQSIAPSKEVFIQQASTEWAFLEEAPTEWGLTEETSTEETSTEWASTEWASTEEASIEEASIEQDPIEQDPIEQDPLKQAFFEQVSIEQDPQLGKQPFCGLGRFLCCRPITVPNFKMSWNLTKKFKETHLGPLKNPLGRSTSQSATQTTAPEPLSEQTPSVSDNGIAASEALVSPPQAEAKPGILIVTLHEGKNFSLPQHFQHAFNSTAQNSSSASHGYSGSMRPNSSSARGQGGMTGSYASSQRLQSSSSGFNNFPTNHGRYSSRYLPYALLDFDKVQVFVDAVSGTPENPYWAGENTSYKFDVSRKTDLSVQLYLRNPNARPGVGRNEDIFLGVCRITPRFDEPQPYVEDPKLSKKDKEKAALAHAEQQKRLGQSGTAWIDVAFGTGSVKIGVRFVENQAQALQIEDFELLKVVGKGSFGKVMQVQKRDTGRIYALKTIRKAHIISRSEVAHTLAERSVLAQINNPFIVPLKFSFQSPEKLYFVLAFVNGGELFYHLQQDQRFDINRARFYTAELLCALECLHGFNVIYRDLKPENILLDYTGHIALCDFGLCKLDMKDEDKTNTFCGTPEYLAPELLSGHGYTKTVDWWTLGVLLYEMLTGLPPYYDENTNTMYRKILYDPLLFPGPEVVPPAAKDLLIKLLDRKPDQRLGANGASEIKAHPFFHSIDWRKLLQRKYDPTFKPNVLDALDTKNFSSEFTSEAPTDSYVDGPILSSTAQQQFSGFSYNRPVAGLGDGGGSVKDPSFTDF